MTKKLDELDRLLHAAYRPLVFGGYCTLPLARILRRLGREVPSGEKRFGDIHVRRRVLRDLEKLDAGDWQVDVETVPADSPILDVPDTDWQDRVQVSFRPRYLFRGGK